MSDTLRDTIAPCEAWYIAEPSIATFILRSRFNALGHRGWTGPQGVPTSHYDPFQKGVLPHLVGIANILSTTPAAEPIDELDKLVVAYRDSIKATP